jgi:hypothetical protein
MAQSNATNHSEQQARAARLAEIITANWMSQAVYVAAQLCLADLLADGPKTSLELATATGTHAPSLHRLLRALTSIEICRECDDGTFGITPMGLLLGSTTDESLRSWALFVGGAQWPIWANLLYSVKTGESARKQLTGAEGFEHLERDPARAAIFNQAMAELTRPIAQELVKVYDLSAVKRIVDVGGGYGVLLATVLMATATATGVLFDMPHAAEGARQSLAAMGLAGRCEFVAGSFFESVPGGGDAYLLKSIIHDWDDNHCQLILANIRRAMAAAGKLLIVERIMPERLQATTADRSIVRSDLNMLVGPGGHERTEAEFRALLGSTGFQLTRILPLGLTANLLEAAPAQ